MPTFDSNYIIICNAGKGPTLYFLMCTHSLTGTNTVLCAAQYCTPATYYVTKQKHYYTCTKGSCKTHIAVM